ncbi:hypothetical protein ACQ5SP_10240 [Rhodovulum sp. YNF3179]|uniref:hypothetical protein n=1 Tax=Rhodovulum sp. YNF3179 TaxID=3425127 RepID=UPI003D32DC68
MFRTLFDSLAPLLKPMLLALVLLIGFGLAGNNSGGALSGKVQQALSCQSQIVGTVCRMLGLGG